jgi:hypothetical protein
MRTGGAILRQTEADKKQLRIKGREKLRQDMRLVVAYTQLDGFK